MQLFSQTVFWSESGAILKSRNLVTNEELVLFQTEINDPDLKIVGITLDTISRRVFFQVSLNGNSLDGTLKSISYDGSNLESTFSCPLLFANYHYEEEALYHLNNNIFNNFLGCPSDHSVLVADLEGGQTEIYACGIQGCQELSSLQLDEERGELYFVETDQIGISTIKKMNLDGSGIQNLPFSFETSFTSEIAFHLDSKNDAVYVQKSDATLGSDFQSCIIKTNESGANFDTIFLVEEATPGAFTSSFLGGVRNDNKLFIDTENEKLYFFWGESFIFPPQTNQYLIQCDLDGSNLDTIAINEFGDLNSWVIDPSVSDSRTHLGSVIVEHLHNLNLSTDLNTLSSALATCQLEDNVSSCNREFFQVCADGTKASVFKITGETELFNYSDLQIEVFDDGIAVEDLSLYGGFNLFAEDDGAVFVEYQHPNWMYKVDDKFLDLELQLSVRGDLKGSIKLRIWRAPVLLVHGWFSNDESLNYLEDYLIGEDYYNEPFIYKANYYIDSDLGIEDVDYFILNSIYSELLGLRVMNNVSAGSVDVLGHSTGGLLVRSYLQRDYYQNNIHKLITCNTPHSGTQWANLVSDESTVFKPLYCEFLEEFDDSFFDDLAYNCGDRVISDLKVNSSFINDLNTPPSLNRNKVPTHVIVTDEPLFDDLDDAIGNVIQGILRVKMKKILESVTDIAAESYLRQFVYNGSEHDVFVPANSQDGGIQNSCSNCLTQLSGNHWDISDCIEIFGLYECEDETEVIVEVIKDKLIGNPNGNDFTLGGFMPNTLGYSDQNTGAANPSSLDVEILSPIEGETINYGENFVINVVGSISVTDLEVYVQGERDYLVYSSSPNSSSTVSLNSEQLGVGRRNILVVANDSISGEFIIEKSKITISPTFLFDSISINPMYLYLSQGQQYQINEMSGYYNAIPFDLSALQELSFTSTSGVIEVGENNIFSAVQTGRDSIVVSISGLDSYVIVEVVELQDTTTSNRRHFDVNQKNSGFRLFPSPAYEMINILPEFELSRNSADLKIVNLLGQELLVKKGVYLSKNEPYSISLSSLSNGAYYLIVNVNDENYSKSFIKINR